MATLRESFLGLVDGARELVDDYGLRTHGLTIRTRTWAGEIGRTSYTDSDLVIDPRPKIREVKMSEIASSGGMLSSGDLVVTKITPAFGGVGYTGSQLRPPGADNVQHIYLVTDGPAAGEYALHETSFTKNFEYGLVLRRTNVSQ
jgi:hypothetical protein